MRVGELIDALARFPREATVCVQASTGEFSMPVEVSYVEKMTFLPDDAIVGRGDVALVTT